MAWNHQHPLSIIALMLLAVILAQIVATYRFVPTPIIMDKLPRAALVLSLKGYGETPPEQWTKVELCARLQELAAAGEVEPPKTSKNKTPLEEAVAALNKAAGKKSVLQAHVESLGIKMTGNETIPILQQKAMAHLAGTVEPVGTDKVGFGKYANQSYMHVKIYDEQYCRWVVTTAKEGGCSMYLSRFANWLTNYSEKTTKNAKPKVDMNEFVPKKDVKKKAEQPASRHSSPELEEPSSSSTGPTEAMMKQLMEAVATLTEEVKTLKEDRGEKTRKTATKPDVMMDPTRTTTQDRA